MWSENIFFNYDELYYLGSPIFFQNFYPWNVFFFVLDESPLKGNPNISSFLEENNSEMVIIKLSFC